MLARSGCHVSRVNGLGVQVIHTYIDIILKVILSKVLESLCGLDNVFVSTLTNLSLIVKVV